MEKSVIIIDTRGWRLWLRHTLSTIVLVFMPIVFGIAADSSAMQWAGFFFGLVLLLAMAKRLAGQNEYMTIDQARAHLDRMEARHD